MSTWAALQDLAGPGALAASTLLGLALWASAADLRSAPPARATGRPTWHVVGCVALLVALQIAAAWAWLGVAGGLFTVACAWMWMGWCFVLALNAVPQRTLNIARWVGAAGALGCMALLAHAA